MATEKSVLAVIRASRPQFRNSADKVAFAINSILLASGYNLNVTGPQAFTDDALATSSSDEVGIEGWNEVEENYAFVYSSPEESSKKVLVKCLVMNNQLFVDALAAGSSNPVHLEIKIDDYVAESDDTKYSSQYKNLGELVDTINKQVIFKLNGSSTASTLNAITRYFEELDRNAWKEADEIAFAIHSAFKRAEFSLKYTGPQAFADNALPTPLSDEERLEGWNDVKGNYAFVYSSPERIPRDVLLKCLVINKQLFVDVLASGSSNPIHLELNIDDFIDENKDTKYGSRCKNLGKLMDRINKEVISKLIGSSRANGTMGMRSHLQSCRGPIPLSIHDDFKKNE